MAVKRKRISDEAKQQQMQEFHDNLAEQVEKLKDTDAWAKLLKFSANFRKYSFNNMVLIQSQLPNATTVTGFRKWQELGRQVRKGEKALKIFGFREHVIETGEQEFNPQSGKEVPVVEKRVFYPLVNVFDISQTDAGPEWEEPQIAKRLTGDDDFGIIKLAEEYLVNMGWSVSYESLDGEVNGYTKIDGSKRIVIEESLPNAAKAKTLLHETGHAIMHSDLGAKDYQENRGLREVEAESVAYMTAHALGLDSAEYSVGYVAGWANGDTEFIRNTAQKVISTSRKMVDSIEQLIEQKNGLNVAQEATQSHIHEQSEQRSILVSLPTLYYAEVDTILKSVPAGTIMNIETDMGEIEVSKEEAMEAWTEIAPGEGFTINSVGEEKYRHFQISVSPGTAAGRIALYNLSSSKIEKRIAELEEFGYIKPSESLTISNTFSRSQSPEAAVDDFNKLDLEPTTKEYLLSVVQEYAGTGKSKSWSEVLPTSPSQFKQTSTQATSQSITVAREHEQQKQNHQITY